MAEVITSRANARVKQLRAAFAGQERLARGLIAIEGEHLLEEALRSGQALKSIFISERRELPTFVPNSIEAVRLANDVFQSCVETPSPQGIAALIVPPLADVEKMLLSTPLILIAVGLQDPGNLGTLVRSAEAFAATGVLTTPGTVSVWNQKALRASAGSAFRIPVATADAAAMERLEQAGVRLLAAMKDEGRAADEVELGGPVAIMIGNEGVGLQRGWAEMADERVTIPCPGPVESLNAAVAGSLLMYEASRQRRGR